MLSWKLRSATGGNKDANFRNVTLLLPGNGTNGAQNNLFTDSSPNNFAITRNGNTTQGTFSPYGSNWSNYFDGTGDYLSLADNAAWDFGSGNFTVEAWFYTASTATQSIVAQVASTGNASASSFSLYASVSGFPAFYISFGTNYTTITSGTATPVNQWVHLAAVRNGSTITLYQNGVSVATASVGTSAVTLSAANLGVGRTGDFNGEYLTGYISNLRIVKGTALYTTNFTPPTQPLTAVANTSLLTCQSNRFRDASANNFTITRNADVSVQKFSPFNPTAAYDPAVVGASGYFDGTGDFLGVASNAAFGFGVGDFTVECWFYLTSVGDVYRTMVYIPHSTGSITIRFGNNTAYNTLLQAYVVGATAATVYSVNKSQAQMANGWHHVALTRSGTTCRIFVDGVQENVGSGLNATSFPNASFTDSTSITNNATNEIGRGNDPVTAFIGYINGARVIKGTALYTANFTPPTAPLTAITNTSLLLNFTNAGVIDNSGLNDLETVGNAQISTVQSRFGGSSLAFDGTGDYLVSNAATTDLYAFGAGDFTIEFWYYSNNTGVQHTIYDSRPSGTNGVYMVVYKQTGNIMSIFVNNVARITGSVNIAANTWYHIAVSRSGTSTRLFVNGVQDGSTYSDTNAYLNGSNRPVIGTDGATLGSSPLNGYIDDLRITKGIARYVANFTPPQTPHPIK